ncbi:MAG: TetR/AcrR family transcriptional regulator [Dehalococcoidales bacterium]|nr:TetR/AcrR family transcriptional regulator [Dehalococcoidales bacterium]
MAKGFTEKERELIRNKLLEKGKEHFERFGLKRTNVADLAREAGIAKGSFYLFFESKEDLFLTINEEFDKHLQHEAAQTLEKASNPKETFRKALLNIIELFNDDPMLKLAANREEFESLSRKIPADKFRKHQESSVELLAGLIESWQQRGLIRDYNPRVIAGAVKSLYYVVLHRKFIGEDIFPQVADLLIDSLVANLVAAKE